MVVDFLRSVHLAPARMVLDDGTETLIRWYRAAPDAKALPLYTAFGSSVWEDTGRRPEPIVGQLAGPLTWRPNKLGWGPPPGDHYHGPPEWFEGLPRNWLDLPQPAPDPLCEPPMLLVQYTDETLQIFDVVEIDIDKDRGLILLDDLGTGIAHITTEDASLTRVGVVNTVAQSFNGLKTFDDAIVSYGGTVPATPPIGCTMMHRSHTNTGVVVNGIPQDAGYVEVWTYGAFEGGLAASCVAAGPAGLDPETGSSVRWFAAGALYGSFAQRADLKLWASRGETDDVAVLDLISSFSGGAEYRVNGTNIAFSNERAQDAVGSILQDSPSIELHYDDGTPEITAELVAVDGGTW